MATPCTNNPDEVIRKVVDAKANADKFDKFVNGTDTQTVQLGTGAPTPVIRNAVRQMMADAAWAKQYIANAPEGDISLNNAAAMGTSTSRTLAERFSDIVNVKDFGAIGDGSTDDTDAINAALAVGGFVYMPKGVYIITESLAIPSYTTLCGAGKGVTVIRMSADTDIYYHTICTKNAESFLARNCDNTNVDARCSYYVDYACVMDLTVDGNCYNRPNQIRYQTEYLGTEPGTNIEFQRCRWCVIKNVESINGPQHNINIRAGAGSYGKGVSYVAKYPSQYISIIGCNTDNEMFDDGITTHDSEYIYINDCRVFMSRNTARTNSEPIGNGIEIDDGSRYVWVTNCLSNGSSGGYQAKGHANTPPAHHIWFTNCIAKNNHDGFVIASGTDVGAFEIEYACHDIFLEGCSIENCYQFTDRVSWAGEAHYIQMLNTRNVCITNLSVNGKTSEPANYNTEIDRAVYFRHRGRCENIVYDNVFLQNVDDNAVGSDKALFQFEGQCVRISITKVLCEAFTKYYMFLANAGTARFSVNNVKLFSGGADYTVIKCANTNNFEALNIQYTGSKGVCSAGSTGYIMRSQHMSEDRVFSSAFTQQSVSPIRLLGVQDSDSETVDAYSTVGLPFDIQNSSGGMKWIGGIALRTRYDSPSSNPGSTGTFLSLYCRDDEDNIVTPLEITHRKVAPAAGLDDISLGLSIAPFSHVYATSGTVETSDVRLKTSIEEPSEALMRAWGHVKFKLYQLKSSVAKKGSAFARLHLGVLAQEVEEAFSAEGLDARRYGLFCYDTWEDIYENKYIVDSEAVLDENGVVIEPEKTHVEKVLVKPAGDKYGMRYEEALVLECAYQRWLGEKRDARIAELEARLNKLSGNGSAPEGAE